MPFLTHFGARRSRDVNIQKRRGTEESGSRITCGGIGQQPPRLPTPAHMHKPLAHSMNPLRLQHNVLRQWISQERSCNSSRRHFRASKPSSARIANPYPFPKTPDPTPYQIFHLPSGASESDIKRRCMFYSVIRRFERANL